MQPLTGAFDGFFVHSRGGSGLPLVAPGKSADLAGSIGRSAALFRTDLSAPVMDVQSETDLTSVLNSYAARQPDNSRLRIWEVVGTSHADAHLMGSGAKYVHCGVPINNGPLYLVAQAGYRDLVSWVARSKAPPTAPRIVVTPGPVPQIQRNGLGIALGGVRTPPVDVPAEVLSGVPGPNPSTICLLLGSGQALSAAQLTHRYPSRSAYLAQYRADMAKVIKAGFILPQDGSNLLAFAQPSRIPG